MMSSFRSSWARKKGVCDVCRSVYILKMLYNKNCLISCQHIVVKIMAALPFKVHSAPPQTVWRDKKQF